MVLLATKKAKLVHRVLRRGSSSVLVPFIDTMEIRESLKNKVAVDLNKSEAETSQQSETSARKVNIDLPDELPSDMVEEDALDINMPERLPDELDDTAAAVETPIKLS
jgi:MinD-like ATPase involved in chromosome partitioning or flagellar assembly